MYFIIHNDEIINCKEQAIKAIDIDYPSFLYPYQRDGVEFLSLNNRALLGDEMGVGKTIQSIIAIPKDSKTIVICPASLKLNWADEIKKWRGELSSFVCSGKGSFRMPNINEVVIINYDIIPEIDPSWDFTNVTLICDESQKLKNYKTKRTQKVSLYTKKATRVWFLSGTPLMNHPFDLYGMLEAGNMNPYTFNSFLTAFNGRKGKYGYDFGTPTASASEILKRVMLRRVKSEVLKDLPSKIYKTITIELSKSETKKIDGYLKDAKINMKDILKNLVDGEMPSFEEMAKIRSDIATFKIPSMIEIVEDFEEQDTPLVVFFCPQTSY